MSIENGLKGADDKPNEIKCSSTPHPNLSSETSNIVLITCALNKYYLQDLPTVDKEVGGVVSLLGDSHSDCFVSVLLSGEHATSP